MLSKVTRLSKTFLTVWTLKRSFSSMRPYMNFEMTGLTKLLWAVWTLEGFFTCMGSHVSTQSWRMRKSFATEATLKWFLTVVNAQVQRQVARLSKCLWTLRTLIWLLSRVHAHVCGQVTWLTEAFGALWARERLFPCVSSQVSAQGCGRRIFLRTHWTFQWINSGMATKVCGKFIWTGKLFTALRTLKYLLWDNTFTWPNSSHLSSAWVPTWSKEKLVINLCLCSNFHFPYHSLGQKVPLSYFLAR